MIRRASWAMVIAGILAAITGGRVWVRYTVEDPVLGPGARAASGYAVSSALSAACIVALAAGLAALLTRRTPRGVALLVLALDAAWGVWLTVRVVANPAQAVATSGSSDLGLTTTADVGAATTPYPFIFLGAAAVVTVSALLVARATSQRFARTGAPRAASAPDITARGRGPARPLPAAERERRANAATWDELSRGEDPTATTDGTPPGTP